VASLRELRKNPIVDLVVTVIIAVGIAYLVQAYIVKPYRVPSGSMEPTISIGERIIASRFTLRFQDPARNQIIVFHPNGVGSDVYDTNSVSDETFVKRLIGMPGETIGAVGGHVYVCSGKGPAEGGSVKSTPGCSFLDQPFVSSPQDDFGPTKIADNRYFMMGDNRADSDDSRNWGAITKDQMIGVAFMSYWPPSRISIW
jgi:signal peptidase I